MSVLGSPAISPTALALPAMVLCVLNPPASTRRSHDAAQWARLYRASVFIFAPLTRILHSFLTRHGTAHGFCLTAVVAFLNEAVISLLITKRRRP
jgi:hypothetical protein